jgi:hypothetical protein
VWSLADLASGDLDLRRRDHAAALEAYLTTLDLLRARKIYAMTEEVWQKILDKARPYVDRHFQSLLDGPACEYTYEWGGPLMSYLPGPEWALDL